MKKRIACLLLALVMLVGLIPATAIPAKAAGIGYSDAGLRVIKQYEGFHKNAYEAGGKYYIGYNTPSVQGATITEANADKLLREELDKLAGELGAKFTASMVQKRMDALIWYSYSEGRSTGWAVSGNELYEAVVNNVSSSALVDAMCTNGIDNIAVDDKATLSVVTRRLAMANLYLTGSYNPYDAGGCLYPVLRRCGFLLSRLQGPGLLRRRDYQDQRSGTHHSRPQLYGLVSG